MVSHGTKRAWGGAQRETKAPTLAHQEETGIALLPTFVLEEVLSFLEASKVLTHLRSVSKAWRHVSAVCPSLSLRRWLPIDKPENRSVVLDLQRREMAVLSSVAHMQRTAGAVRQLDLRWVSHTRPQFKFHVCLLILIPNALFQQPFLPSRYNKTRQPALSCFQNCTNCTLE